MRSYEEFCALARSLDLVGGRWTLLIVRELVLRGPSRYTDLRQGLPGITSNLLADRLRELESAGVVSRREAPPPIATTLYELTPRGEQLRPVLEDLIRWGMPLMIEPVAEAAVQSNWLAWAIELMISDREPDAAPITIELRTGDQPIVVEAREGAVHARAGVAEEPEATLTGEAQPILGVLLGLIDLGQAEAVGVECTGDMSAVARLRPGLEQAALLG
jgi:DNA-binding HxlR family transcriptional regulator